MILATNDWWKGVKAGCKAFRKRPLPFPDLHETVFASRLLVGDHGDVAGEDDAADPGHEDAEPDDAQPAVAPSGYTDTMGDPSEYAPTQDGVAAWSAAWNSLYVDLEANAATHTSDLSSPPQPGGSGSSRRKGKAKRSNSGVAGTGSCSKRSKSATE